MKPCNHEALIYQAVLSGELEIRADGTIWRVKKKGWDRWLKKTVIRPCKRVRAENSTGKREYLQVRTMIDGTRYYCQAQRLIWFHLHGPIPEGQTVNHKNGIKTDNRPRNLELATQSEQLKHAYRIGLKSQDGQKNPAARLTDRETAQIRNLYAEGHLTQKAVSEQFNVAHQTISKIVRGDRRKKQGGPTADYTHRRMNNHTIRNQKGQFTSIK